MHDLETISNHEVYITSKRCSFRFLLLFCGPLYFDMTDIVLESIAVKRAIESTPKRNYTIYVQL